MSFPNKDTWMPRGDACLTYGDVGYDNSSRIELKRGHQWLMDTNGPELCSNKKQEMDPVNSCSWHDTSGFQSVSEQFTDLLFRSSPVRTTNMAGGSIHSLGGEHNSNMARKDFDDRYGSNSSMGLSMSHIVDVPSRCLNFGGIRKVKVNQVRDSNAAMSASMGLPYDGRENEEISLSCPYMNSDNNGISFTPTYSNVDKNNITNGSIFGKEDAKYIPAGQIFSEEGSNFISMGHNHTKGNDHILSIGQPFHKRDVDLISVGGSYEKVDCHNIISISPPYEKGPENFVTMPPIGRADENFGSVDPEHRRGDDNLGSIAQTFDKENTSIKSIGPSQEKGDSNILSVGQSYNRIERNTISFGSYHDEPDTNPSSGIVESYNLFIRNQNLVQGSEVAGQKDLIVPNAVPIVNSMFKANIKTDTIPKNKEPNTSKKPPSNNFPSNVKSLLTTGMLDGVPVKYVSWSREKNLKGVIRGTGYLCGCLECNFAKVLNAYEFERHANCKTKHPNNHIYFENGKTIYAVVQELKNTPQEMLFDTIQNVTGSLINQKNFRAWKASYQAATRELQRIYGNDKLAFHLEPKTSF